MDSCHLFAGWRWLRYRTLYLDERSLYLRHEGRKMKYKFMKPRYISKDQRKVKEKIGKQRTVQEVIKTSKGKGSEEKEMEVEKNMMEYLFVNVFLSKVCDVTLLEQKDKHVNETHQLPCLKRKLVALLCICSTDDKQIRQTQRMELFIITYQGWVVLA